MVNRPTTIRITFWSAALAAMMAWLYALGEGAFALVGWLLL
jgi:hypothetical protein